MMKKSLIGFAFILLMAYVCFAGAQTSPPTVCCEKTTSGLYCQDVPPSQCASTNQPPTSCKSVSYCKPGTCFDSKEGTCLDNTPQTTCNQNNGTWSETRPPQCELGCCILGDQAAFVTLVRCKKLAASLGLNTNYKKEIKSETECIASVQSQEKGACVYTSEFQKTCRVTTRADCAGISGGKNVTSNGEFFVGKLCSAEELGTICGPTTKTTCVPGKEEVYYVDSCGNTANIYDSKRYSDPIYWSDIVDKSQSCNPNDLNANSATCGNCNYLLGSFCRKTNTGTGNTCASLNCAGTSKGKELGRDMKHGESWCVNDDQGTIREGNNSVGSRFYKHICINGEEVLEACADFRQQECIDDSINTSIGDFYQAACRVNRWQDCAAQTEESDCTNTDKRDCLWIGGTSIKCVPENPPGLNFWEDSATTTCAQANVKCDVTYEEGLFGIGGEKCSGNCECLNNGWLGEQLQVCGALGDCGPKTNWLGDIGNAPASGAFKGMVGYTYARP